MDGPSLVSSDVLARYAGDAASEVSGVSSLAESALHRGRAVTVTDEGGRVAIAVHLELEWGRSAPEVGVAVERRVREYVEQMAKADVGSVDVVFERIGPAPTAR